jgi:hypothetical protein
MPFGVQAYRWSELVQNAPDGIYCSSYSQACGRSVTELWVAKEGGRITRSGYRHYASCNPPKGPSRPPVMVDDHSVRLWVINGEVGGEWYAWSPPAEPTPQH